MSAWPFTFLAWYRSVPLAHIYVCMTAHFHGLVQVGTTSTYIYVCMTAHIPGLVQVGTTITYICLHDRSLSWLGTRRYHQHIYICLHDRSRSWFPTGRYNYHIYMSAWPLTFLAWYRSVSLAHIYVCMTTHFSGLVQVGTTSTCLHDRSLSWLGTGRYH